MSPTQADKALEALVVLIADSNAYTRKLIRSMLMSLGVKSIHEAVDGIETLDAVHTVNPDILVMDWNLSGLDGREVMRIIRAPGAFPKPNLPVVMLTDIGKRSRVRLAIRLGVHELLVKPISPKALKLRILSILLRPRPMIRAGKYYIPLPRRRTERAEMIRAA